MNPSNPAEFGTCPAAPGFGARLVAQVAAHASAALAAIVVLTVLLVAALVYYRGVLGAGPFAAAPEKEPARARRPRRRAADEGYSDAEGSGDEASPETERLIATINGTPAPRRA